MTLRQFARATGWPYAELLQLRWSEFNEILALYGLRQEVTVISVNRRTKTVTMSNRILPGESDPKYDPPAGVWSSGIRNT